MALSRPAVVFPDLEAWAVTYLRDALSSSAESFASGVVVRNVVPDVVPARLVTVRDDGGPRQDDVRKIVSLGVNVWAEDAADCSDLARYVAALFESPAALTGGVVGHVGSTGPYPVAESSGRPRRYLSVDLLVAGEPL